jgi:hypothetical protein
LGVSESAEVHLSRRIPRYFPGVLKGSFTGQPIGVFLEDFDSAPDFLVGDQVKHNSQATTDK